MGDIVPDFIRRLFAEWARIVWREPIDVPPWAYFIASLIAFAFALLVAIGAGVFR